MNFSSSKLFVIFIFITATLFAQTDKNEYTLSTNQNYSTPEVLIEPFIVNTEESSFGTLKNTPKIKIDNEGNVIAAWNSWVGEESRIYYTVVSEEGDILVPETEVASRGKYSSSKDYNYTLAVSDSQDIVFVWERKEDNTKSIYYKKLNYSNNTSSEPTLVIDDLGPHPQELRVALSKSNNFLIVWGYNPINAKYITKDGTSSQKIKVDDNNSYQPIWGNLQLKTFSNDKFLVTWSERRDGDRIYSQFFNSGEKDGHNTNLVTEEWMDPSSFTITDINDINETFTSIYQAPNEDYYWRSYYQVHSLVYPNEQIEHGRFQHLFSYHGIIAQESGDFAIYYISPSNTIFVALYRSNLGLISERIDFQLDKEGEIIKGISLHLLGDDTKILNVNYWTAPSTTEDSFYKLYNAKYDDSGNLIDEFEVTQQDSSFSANQIMPSILADESGEFNITWVDSRNGFDEIFASKFSSQGERIEEEKIISIADNSRKWIPKIFADPNSENRVITWSDYPIEEDWGYNVKNREINNSLEYASDILTASDYLMYTLCFPKILFVDDNIYTIWRVTEEYSVKELYLQKYTRSWEPVGNNTKIPIMAPGFRDGEGIGYELTHNKNLLVAWKNRPDGDELNNSINACLYNLEAQPVSESFSVYAPEPFTIIEFIEIKSISENKYLFVWDERLYDGDASEYRPRRIRARIVENENATHDLIIQEEDETINHYYDKDKPFSVIPFGSNFIITWETPTLAKGVLVDDQLNLVNEYVFFEKPTDAIARKFNYSMNDSLLYLTWESDVKNNADLDVWTSVLKLDTPTKVTNNETLTTEYSLTQNYPNPFNPSTKIKFYLPSPLQGEGPGVRSIKLIVYDILGREIKILLKKQLQPGEYEVEFDGGDLPSGVYLYRLSTGEYSEARKMLLIK